MSPLTPICCGGQMLAARLFTSSLDTQDGSNAFRKCHITQKLPLKVQHSRKCRKTLSSYLVFSFVPTQSLAFFWDLMQRVVFINGNLNRAAWQRQKRAQPLKWARIGILLRRRWSKLRREVNTDGKCEMRRDTRRLFMGSRAETKTHFLFSPPF